MIGQRMVQRAQREATGLPLTPYMVLAVTPRRIHLLRSGAFWTHKSAIASWDRDQVQVYSQRKVVNHEIWIHVPAEERTVVLEAPRTRVTGELLAALAGHSARAC